MEEDGQKWVFSMFPGIQSRIIWDTQEMVSLQGPLKRCQRVRFRSNKHSNTGHLPHIHCPSDGCNSRSQLCVQGWRNSHPAQLVTRCSDSLTFPRVCVLTSSRPPSQVCKTSESSPFHPEHGPGHLGSKGSNGSGGQLHLLLPKVLIFKHTKHWITHLAFIPHPKKQFTKRAALFGNREINQERLQNLSGISSPSNLLDHLSLGPGRGETSSWESSPLLSPFLWSASAFKPLSLGRKLATHVSRRGEWARQDARLPPVGDMWWM